MATRARAVTRRSERRDQRIRDVASDAPIKRGSREVPNVDPIFAFDFAN